jgi:MinD superfamily P-loop ATPase
MAPVRNGQWYVSETRHGPMVHARLAPGGENSGKLVALVRHEARSVAKARGLPLLILDGPPGIGCPVIASLAGADLVLAVAEPTCSGRQDLERLAALADHFRIPLAVCLNKADLNAEIADGIEHWCRERGTALVGRIPYAPEFLDAQERGRSVVELDDGNGAAAHAVREVWGRVRAVLEGGA